MEVLGGETGMTFNVTTPHTRTHTQSFVSGGMGGGKAFFRGVWSMLHRSSRHRLNYRWTSLTRLIGLVSPVEDRPDRSVVRVGRDAIVSWLVL